MNRVDDKKKIIRITIVGSNRLQNELMACFLQSSLSVACNHCLPEDLDNCFEIQLQWKNLYLFDAQDTDLAFLSRFFGKNMDSAKANHLAAVYNMDPYTKADKQIPDCCLQEIFYKNEPLGTVGDGIRAILSDGDKGDKKFIVSETPVWGNRKKLKGELSKELTVREKDVLLKLYSGDSNKKIAEDLGVSFYTVKSHIYNIFRKINVNNRFRATLWAVHHL